MPLFVQCPVCEGVDEHCAYCSGAGEIHVKGCPRKLIGPDAWQTLLAAERAEKGVWPVAGGWLDQTAACLAGVDYVEAELEAIKAQKRKT